MSDTADTAAPVKKQRPGTFSSTNQPNRHRTEGRIPYNVKQDVVRGLAAHGSDGLGKDGLKGYVTYLARNFPKQAVRLIERLLPPSVVVANTGSKASIHTVNVVSVPSGTFLSSEDIERYRTPGLKLEHAPLQQLEQLEPLEHFEPIAEPAPLIEEPQPQTETERQLLAKLEARLANMPDKLLFALAGIADGDER